jgi:hypothetical protein
MLSGTRKASRPMDIFSLGALCAKILLNDKDNGKIRAKQQGRQV